MEQLKDLLPSLYFSLGHINGISRIPLNNTRAIEMLHAIQRTFKEQDILPWIVNQPLRLKLPVLPLKLRRVGRRPLQVDASQPKTEGHRLTEGIPFPSQMVGATAQSRQIRITGGINEHIRLYRKHTRRGCHRHGAQASALHLSAG